jgi:outer membrane protein OmpA-like peptidoglycan-associated protein
MEATTPYSDKVTANIQGNNVTYSVSNGTLPAGLTLNPNTGAITGSPTTPGDYWFEVTATDGQSVLTQAFAGWINVAPPTPPVAPKDGEYHWQGNLKTKISWTAAPNAVSYVVVWRGNILCETKKTSCLTDGLVPGDNAVRIIAHFADGRTATGKAYFNGKNTRMSVTPHFATNSAVLSEADKAALKKLATYLKSRGMYKVVLIGYTDVTGPVFVDTGLSLRRAQAVKAYLSKFMSTKQFTIKGLGRTTPAASNATAAGRAKNRRVEIYAK